ncbi:metallophosphoesterase family protein [Celeribacter persicus]|uniref:3',5'-cyclic AMP phosphodiesterase CpdA n=1 Tax=Celeribacter persicus TaxID=1651082 RepID=A0A2T5HBK8_9RHOB|nr:metallophosphoesterase [Celeribacter persicus]PTQ68959.1 3',5'-cyclic AMP phosphodiesterase CpdA [Celeribacter persicus]
MTRLIHLSDLHFGRTDPALAAPLLRTLERLEPTLVVISGDVTQRARRSQFEKARRFIEAIEAPVLAVPGNHDTPLDNLVMRWLAPFARYKRAISANLEPTFETPEMQVVGINTVNPFAWQSGKLSERHLTRMMEHFGPDDGRLRVAVLHHPLEQSPTLDKPRTHGAKAALTALSAAGADLVLSGHLHTAQAVPFTQVPGLLFVQAGTALSTRTRGTPNTFNQIELSEDGGLTITVWSAADQPTFLPQAPRHYLRGPVGWVRKTGHDRAMPLLAM